MIINIKIIIVQEELKNLINNSYTERKIIKKAKVSQRYFYDLLAMKNSNILHKVKILHSEFSRSVHKIVG